MFKYILSILNSKSPNRIALKYLVFVAIIVVIYLLYKKVYLTKGPGLGPGPGSVEGFQSQESPFLLKQDDSIYDDFYSDIYEELTDAKQRDQWTLVKVLAMTEPSKPYSTFLDVGSGTGHLVNRLQKMGYRAFGIDKSAAMVNRCEQLYPDTEIVKNDVLDSMNFDRSTFTHVLCTNFTIYEIQDKPTFFKNCYFWMKPNAYLIIHLTNRNDFNAVSPLWRDKVQWMPFFKSASKQTTDSLAEFEDYQYKVSYKTGLSTSTVVVKTETMTDKHTGHIRQNEQNLYMDTTESILQVAAVAGFILKGKVDFSDYNGEEKQYLYILERTM
jgi:SAM-dependent methyltransferase